MPATLASLSVLMCMDPKGVLIRTLSPLLCLLWETSQPERTMQATPARSESRSAFVGFMIQGTSADSFNRDTHRLSGRIRRWEASGSVG
jgi:hypothetical protein